MRSLSLALCLSIAVAVPASAQLPAEAVARARTLFEQGQAAYAAGHFEDAARKMVEAYEITTDD